MLEQYGNVVATEEVAGEEKEGSIDSLHPVVWVNIRKGDTSCSGCSQGVACCQNSYFGKRETEKLLAVNNPDQLTLHVGSRVLIGIPEKGVLYGAVMAYLLPLLCILAALLISNQLFGLNDVAHALSAVIGFIVSISAVRIWSHKQANNPKYNAQLLKKLTASDIDVQNITSS